jgi:hypothetical protein
LIKTLRGRASALPLVLCYNLFMSFETLKVAELRELADNYAVDIDAKDSKATILAKLAENGVTWEYHKEQLGEPVEAAEEKKNDDTKESPVFDSTIDSDEEQKVLLKMTRANSTFQVRGATFTQANPYAIVSEEDADFIMDEYEGFHIATPREVREFYK